MTRMSIRSITLAAATAILTAVAGSQSALAETVIKFSFELPVTHSFATAADRFAKEVAEKTGGEVKIQLYPAGQLAKDSNFVKSITAGTIDGGLSPTLYWTGVMPLAGIFDVPYLVRSHDEAKTVLNSPVGDRLLAKLADFNSVGIGYFNYGFGIFGNNVRPLKTPSDLKGLKVRTNNDIGSKLLQTFGASPTFMSGSEVFLGLQRGTVDGSHTGLSSMVSRKMYEVVKYLTIDNHNMIPYFVIIRKDVFDGLKPEYQAAVREAARNAGNWAAEQQVIEDRDAVAELEKRGVQIIDLNPEQLEIWSKTAQPVTDFWLTRVGDEGKEMITQVNKILGR